ncbi:hypothetical protein [Pseudomonas orientalis]|uniref:hypothetical protein n=1 Tax=Pseudomonas orientalis TaxID=76758 RepID=UPI000F56D0F5
MELSHPDRELITWALSSGGLGRGHMMNQRLNGIGGQFCSVAGGQPAISDKGWADPDSSNISNYIDLYFKDMSVHRLA